MKLIMLIAALTLSTAAHAGNKDEVPRAKPIGKPVSCIRISEVQETRVRNDQVIDFVVSGNKIYRNTLPYACPQLGFEQRFLHETSTSDYCSVDTITVLQSPGISRGATCGLGEFQPMELIKDAPH